MLKAGFDASAQLACITFGAPLVGDSHLAEYVQQQGWSGFFYQAVTRHDLVPRVLLSPLAGEHSLPIC